MNSRLCLFIFIIFTEGCLAEDYSFIDDIPIENYMHGDHQENDMDLELLPVRHGRSFPSDEDLKAYFFRSTRSFDDLEDVRAFGPYQDIPRPSFQTATHSGQRKKRNALLPVRTKSVSGLVKNLGEPLEIIPLDTRNLTEAEDKAESRISLEKPHDSSEMVINDFIRFRRAASQEGSNERNSETLEKNQLLSEKLVMDVRPMEDSNRQVRGATEEHWVKQIYPVRKEDELSFDDNIPSSSESMRAPRVHFVTQKFADNGLAPTELKPYERQPRSRHMERQLPRDLPRDFARDIGRENPYHERRFRSYGFPGERERPFFRDEMYSRYDSRDYRDHYRPRYESYNRNDYQPVSTKPQKRIIYYATLPEISRSPPNVDLRDRYRYDRDRYDDRYLSDPYRFGKTYPKTPRYEDEGKTPYPVKVLTDVNVREVKKNPERRIYSEVDRTRYAYNTPPYRTVDG